jgi:hypothetical protein
LRERPCGSHWRRYGAPAFARRRLHVPCAQCVGALPSRSKCSSPPPRALAAASAALVRSDIIFASCSATAARMWTKKPSVADAYSILAAILAAPAFRRGFSFHQHGRAHAAPICICRTISSRRSRMTCVACGPDQLAAGHDRSRPARLFVLECPHRKIEIVCGAEKR